MAQDSGVWKCHPDLKAEWSEFIKDSEKTATSDLNSDLWMNFWRCEPPAATTYSEQNETDPLQNTRIPLQNTRIPLQNTRILVRANSSNSDKMLPSVCENATNESEAQAIPLTESQLEQVNSITVELMDILDMESGNIPNELKEDICSLPPNVVSSLLKELQSQLTDQGAYNFCTLLSEDTEPCLDAALVFQILFLPMLRGDGLKSLGEEVKAGLKQLTERFPSECVSHLLKPLLTTEATSPVHLELLSALIPSLPEHFFLSLLRYFIHQCNAPIEESKILVLSCLLSGAKGGILETKTESPLFDLLPILSSSARALSASESFATLMLKVITALKFSNSSRVRNELEAIVQQNNSFNKQALLNAVKCVGHV